MPKLRMYFNILGAKPYYKEVSSPEEAKVMIDAIADFVNAKIEEKVFPDHCNMTGLEEYSEKEKDWVEWQDENELSFDEHFEEYEEEDEEGTIMPNAEKVKLPEMIIELPEEVATAINRMGLSRIPTEMQRTVDKAIQKGKLLPNSHGVMSQLMMTEEMKRTVERFIQGEKTSSSSHGEMGAEDILGIIHKNGIETEVFKALSIWLVNDREAQIREASQQRATIRTIEKIVNNNPSKSEALNGVKALCECELEEDK